MLNIKENILFSKKKETVLNFKVILISLFCRNPLTLDTDEPVISKPEECSKISNDDSAQEWCPRLHTCHACVATKGCEWEGAKISEYNCRPIEPASRLPPLPLPKNLTNLDKSDKTLSDLVIPLPNTCGLSCSERTSCMNCTNSVCMWCKVSTYIILIYFCNLS